MSVENERFEQSLRELLQKDSAQQQDVDAALERVLKTANRQVGAGTLFTMFGRAFYAVILGFVHGSEHLKPVSRLNKNHLKTNKVN
ncbi:MAG: CrfX protein [Thiopseudomonas sp.]|nr:CrfX protein [Thiopseudomonas sp.]MCK9466313.1 CrfX protein [Thiopseudomonas sp.]